MNIFIFMLPGVSREAFTSGGSCKLQELTYLNRRL